jgi:hypothetical protein
MTHRLDWACEAWRYEMPRDEQMRQRHPLADVPLTDAPPRAASGAE